MPLQQHPVPQDISAYEFRLVGDMTLKQFLQLAGGIGIAFLLFVTPIPAFIRWPLVIMSALGGAALAFLPIEERPLSYWIFSFIKAIYSPTLYLYKEGAAEEVYQTGSVLLSPSVVVPYGEEKAHEYLSSVPTPSELAPFEENEKGFFNKVLTLFSSVAPQQATVQAPVAAAPQAFTESSTPVPVQAPVQVEHVPKEFPVQAPAAYTPEPIAPVFASITPAGQGIGANFSLEASPPNPPEHPNVVVGQVVDATGKIVDGAILEIREAGGPPVRALRTNKVGHFMTVTPLRDGEYEIETEKDGLQFETIKIQATGALIPPILIKAR